MVCVRQAWLVLGTSILPLEDATKGYYCAELDLGYPDVRDVVNNRADRDGIWDRSQFFGGRAVSANIVALTAAGAIIDDAAADFAPFMLPSARPELHYILDRPGLPERVITNLRAAGYTWPVIGIDQRDIQLQWVASDPYARDPATRTATAWAGSSTPPGRTYNLTFNRIYPPGSGSPAPAFFAPAGDVAVRPLLRIYGPITRPWVTIVPSGGTAPNFNVYFQTGYVIAAGAWVDVDTDTKTVYKNSDPAQPDPSALNWAATYWPILDPGRTWRMALQGTSTSAVTQVQAIWQDRYLT